ncbi:MAG: hypothetical protein ACRCUT_03695, partial [Spirochaetota bacterium]
KKAIDSQLKNVPDHILERIQSGEIPYTYHIDTIPNYSDSDIDLDSDFNSDREIAPAELPTEEKPESRKSSKFVKPTESDVNAYLLERGITTFAAQRFIDYYESKGWMIGSSRMKDWRAAVRTWEQNHSGQASQRASPQVQQSPQDRAAEIRAAINE